MMRRLQQSQDALVHAKHDGRTWDGPEQVRRHASIETDHALLLGHKLEALNQAGILWSAVRHGRLTESCPGNLLPSRQRSRTLPKKNGQ